MGRIYSAECVLVGMLRTVSIVMQVLDLGLPREATVFGAVLDARPSVKAALYILAADCIKSFDISA